MKKKVNKKPTKFKPNKRQIALLRAWANPEQKPTITAICETVGINRTTYYVWFSNDDFVEWFEKEWRRAMKDMEPYLDNIGLKKAVKDYKYWEAMQMKYLNFTRKEEQKTTQDVKIDVDGIIDKYDLVKRTKLRRKAKPDKVQPSE